MKQEALFFFRSSGSFTSDVFRIAGMRSRLYWAFLFSRIGLIPAGASLTGPGSAQASRSGWVQTLIRDCPESVFSNPPSEATWAAMHTAPQFFAHSNSSPESLLPVGDGWSVS